MRKTREQVARVAQNLLSVLEPEMVGSVEAAEERTGGVFDEEPEFGFLMDRRFRDFASAIAALRSLPSASSPP